MLNEVSRHLHAALSQALTGAIPLTRTAIEDAGIPVPIRSFIAARLAREGERVAEEIKASRDPWVSENAEVSRSRTALSVVVSRNIQVPTNEREDVIRETVDTVTRYLVRPARTLVEVIFDSDSGEIDVDDAMDRMEGLDAYGYFDDVLRHYFEEKNVEQVDRARLDSVLHRVDRQMTSDFSIDEWMEISAPLFETLAFAPEYEDGIPVDVLRAYFREKEAGLILEKIDDLEADAHVSRQRLRRILEQPITPPPAVEASPPTAQRRKPAPTEREAAVPPAAPAAPGNDEPVPLWKQFQSGPQKENAARPGAIRDDKPVDPGAPLWQRFQSTPSQASPLNPQAGASESRRPADRTTPPPAPQREALVEKRFEATLWDEQSRRPEVKRGADSSRHDPAPSRHREASLEDLESDVLGSRGTRNRKLFVRQIFGGDVEAYKDALDTIARSASWSDASRYIARDVFMRHDVNIYDDAAVTFTDLVEERFAEQHRS